MVVILECQKALAFTAGVQDDSRERDPPPALKDELVKKILYNAYPFENLTQK